jgi:hypothetical protein
MSNHEPRFFTWKSERTTQNVEESDALMIVHRPRWGSEKGLRISSALYPAVSLFCLQQNLASQREQKDQHTFCHGCFDACMQKDQHTFCHGAEGSTHKIELLGIKTTVSCHFAGDSTKQSFLESCSNSKRRRLERPNIFRAAKIIKSQKLIKFITSV